jgi:hypothetical protein
MLVNKFLHDDKVSYIKFFIRTVACVIILIDKILLKLKLLYEKNFINQYFHK